MSRIVEVGIARLPRWLAGFGERHGGCVVAGEEVHGGDGATALLGSWGPLHAATSVAELISLAQPPARLALLIVRRGGYAVALADGEELTARKVGRRHVQSRTAAGGWSQQRFARRRANQADELVLAVQDHAVRLHLGQTDRGIGGAVLGGDRRLLAAVLEDPRLVSLRGLPTRELYDLPDPTTAVLTTALARARSVRIEVTDPG